ncbi:digestive cysteine proteinase 2 [Bemisia tabaci]
MALLAVPQLLLLTLFSSGVFGVPRDRRSQSQVPAAEELSNSDVAIDFELYCIKYNKTYDLVEALRRKAIFSENLLKIAQLNANKENNVEYGMNEMTDLTYPEFMATRANLKPEALAFVRSLPVVEPAFATVQASSKDWRSENKVTPIKNQGSCGSCYTFSTCVGVESGHAIKHGDLTSLSEQQLLDCDRQSSGCNGGWMPNSLDSIKAKGGLMSSSAYPYEGKQRSCRFKSGSGVAQVSDYQQFTSKAENAIADSVLASGPVINAICATRDFQYYKSGIYKNTACRCRGEVNHAVAIVGYGTDDKDGDYWIIKNSWGTSWGEKGYMRIKKGANICSLSNYVWKVNVK